MDKKILDYYTQQSKISDPGKFAKYYDKLPDTIPELVKMVQNTITHIFWIEKKENYGYTANDIIAKGRDPNSELNMRNIEEKLEMFLSLNNSIFSEPENLINRVVGNCRDFALLLVSMLRHKNIPARVRSGAARYFFPPAMDRYEDHYICEFWNAEKSRWQMVDPQIDELQKRALKLTIDPLDLPYDQFLDAGTTWKIFRKGNKDPKNFGIADWHGEVFVLNKLLMELASLFKIEILAWECWGICADAKNIKKLGYDVFDELAEKISKFNEQGTFEELELLFEEDPRYKIPEKYKPWFMKFKF